ncbi:LCP family protein [Evansella sp. AB-P1]|uniref:LCP family protein n=1 Tax=Evansella sp. AB-P1 TaxID=3037653 RepID=UPI00241ED593|nr:LCP family protein [Evansella sp. AB-P1]MDG5786692.1 LCP family protein [Evansella sp. AB-P1]
MNTRSDKHVPKHKKKKKIYRVLLYIGLAFLIVGLSYGSYVGFKFYQALNQIQDLDYSQEHQIDSDLDERDFDRNEDINTGPGSSTEEIEKLVREGNTMSVLIAGVDSEHGQFVGRSDVLMVAAIDLDSQESTLLSIPRDTYVEIAGTGEYDKINHAFARDVNTSVKTVENYLNIPIDHYVAVNFTGFETFIDFLGGIELDVERTIYHNLHPDRIYLYPGLQRVNGENALQYVRFRADNEGDFGRNRRQQQVIKEVIDQTTSIRTVTRLPEVLDIMGNNIRTSMNTRTMFDLTRNLSSLTGDNVETLRLTGDGKMLNGVYYVDVAEEDHLKVVNDLQDRLNIEYKTVKRELES